MIENCKVEHSSTQDGLTKASSYCFWWRLSNDANVPRTEQVQLVLIDRIGGGQRQAGMYVPEVLEARSKGHLYTHSPGKDTALPEIYFFIDSVTIKRYPLKFYQIIHLGLLRTVCLFLIWRCPWVFPCSPSKPKTSKGPMTWLVSPALECNLHPVPSQAPMNWNSETFSCESKSQKPMFIHLPGARLYTAVHESS